jgi:hypothetical protein
MKWIVLGILIGLVMVILYGGSQYCPVPVTKTLTYQELTTLQQEAYTEGANDALQTFALLALQDQLERTNRTYNVLFDVVRDKLSLTEK